MGRRYLPLLVFGAVHLASSLPFLLSRAPGTDAALVGFPLDDVWIHLVYARSFAAFEGFAWNPGQLEAGFTSPLWAMLLAPAFWLPALSTAGLVLVVKGLGIALGVVTSLLAHRVVTRLSGKPRAGLVAGLLIAAEPSLSFAKLSGMEVLLASATVLFTLDALLGEQPVRAGIGLGLAPLARPENAVFSAFAALVLGLMLFERAEVRRLWRALAAPCAAGAAWIVYNLVVTGHPLPATFYAKHEPMALGVFASNLRAIAGPITKQVGASAQGIGSVFALGGAVLLIVRRSRLTATARRCAALFLAYPLLYTLGVAWAHALEDPLAFYFARYFQPALPFLLALLGVGLVSACCWAWPRGRLARVAAVLTSLVPAGGMAAVLLATSARFAWDCQTIQELNVQVARWIAAQTSPEDWVGTADAGAVRFFGSAKTLDLAGLNSHRVLWSSPRAEVDRLGARYLVLFPQILTGQVDGYAKVRSFKVERYTICNCPQSELAIYERIGSQDL